MPNKRHPNPKLLAVVKAAASGEPYQPSIRVPSDLFAITHTRGKPPEDEWILFKTPDEQLKSCFIYEYARTVPWIRNCFHKCKMGEPAPSGVAWGFRPDGTWHFQSESASAFNGLIFELPKGFPDKPYSATKQGKAVLSSKDTGTEYDAPVFSVSPDDSTAFAGDPHKTGDIAASFLIRWEAQDKDILESFSQWLKKEVRDKGFKPLRIRGKRRDSAKLFNSLLFDLGVFRVLTRFNFTPEELRQLLDSHGYTVSHPNNLYRSFERAKLTLQDRFQMLAVPDLKQVMEERRRFRGQA